jgi:Kef-type K+ transport system membrane component KefB
MKPVNQFLLYAGTIAVACVAILLLIRAGSALPQQATAAPPPTGAAGLLQGLEANLEHPLSRLFIQVLVVLFAARLAGLAFARIGIPAVVGESTAGILLGPSLFGLVAPGAFAFVFAADSLDALRLLSQIGICLFMFAVGMEVNTRQVWSRAAAAVAVSHTSIVVPFVLGVGLAYPLFAELAGSRATFTTFALFMGISMSITAFPVLARIIRERGLTHTPLGNTAIACAAVEDVTAWLIMAFVVAIARSTSLGGALLSLALVGLFIAFMALVVRRVLPRWLGQRRLSAPDPSTGTLTLVVCVVIAASFSTEVLGIHSLFGAFLAGAIMPNVGEFRQRIAARVEKFSTVMLLPLFFAFTGLRTQVGLLDDLQGWVLCLLIIAVATSGKLGAGALAARVSGMSWRESLQLGALMNTRGLMELIALNVAYDLQILSPRLFTMLVIMAVVTTFMTGPLLSLFGIRAREDLLPQPAASIAKR